MITGPVIGAVWGITLISNHAWAWSVPLPIRLLYGTALIAAVLTLILAARENRNYRTTRRATLAGLVGLVLLDGLMLTTIAVIAPANSWPMTIAITASTIRILATHARFPPSSNGESRRDRGPAGSGGLRRCGASRGAASLAVPPRRATTRKWFATLSRFSGRLASWVKIKPRSPGAHVDRWPARLLHDDSNIALG